MEIGLKTHRAFIVSGFGHNHHSFMFPILALPPDLLQQKKGNLLANWSTNPTIPGLSDIKMHIFRAIYSLLSPTLLPFRPLCFPKAHSRKIALKLIILTNF